MKNADIKLVISVQRVTRSCIASITTYRSGGYSFVDDMRLHFADGNSLSMHRAYLKAVLASIEYLIDNTENDISVTVYPHMYEIAFEWNDEYLHDGHLADSTRDKDIWKKIISLKEQGLDLNVSESNIMAGLTRLESL